MITRVILLCLALFACGSAGQISDPRLAGIGAEPAPVTTNGDSQCAGTLTGTFDNVVVPPGATCHLEGSRVKGNVLARRGASLYVGETDVDGNIDGVEARVVQVRGGRIGGSIQIADGESAGELGASVYGGTVLTQGNIQIIKMRTGSIRIADVRLEKGSIKVEDNTTSASLAVENNQVAQNLQVFKNRGAGAKRVTNNTVGQVAQCKENESPFTGTPNSAGSSEDQCT